MGAPAAAALVMLLALAGGCAQAPADTRGGGPPTGTEGIGLRLANATFITNDLDRTLTFYQDGLGYQLLSVSAVDGEKSRRTVGALGDDPARIAYLAPAGWAAPAGDDRRPGMIFDSNTLAGLAFIEIASAESSDFPQEPVRPARTAEPILAHRVTNLEEVARRLDALEVTVVQPLGASSSGLSKSMAVLDPNGIRIELYEY